MKSDLTDIERVLISNQMAIMSSLAIILNKNYDSDTYQIAYLEMIAKNNDALIGAIQNSANILGIKEK